MEECEDERDGAAAVEMANTLKLIEACVQVTESEFIKIRSGAENPEDEAWKKMQAQLRKTKTVMESLMRRQHSALALLAGSRGLVEIEFQENKALSASMPAKGYRQRVQICHGDSVPVQKGKVFPASGMTGFREKKDVMVSRYETAKLIHSSTPPRNKGEKIPNVETPTSTRSRSPAKSVSSLKAYTPSPERRVWELGVLRKVRAKLIQKLEDGQKEGVEVGKIEMDLKKIEMELETLETHYASLQNSEKQSKESDTLLEETSVLRTPQITESGELHNISPIRTEKETSDIASNSELKRRGFDDILSKIISGITPSKIVEHAKSPANGFPKDTEDLLELISVTPKNGSSSLLHFCEKDVDYGHEESRLSRKLFLE